MRCAIYARVSTEMDSQSTSIENQIDIFRNYAIEQNWEIVKVYTDKQSGAKGKRPGLENLIEDGKSGVYDVILAKELSRLARNGGLSYKLRDICQQNNLHIVCLDNSINTITGNVDNFGLFAWLYENESANSSRRNKQAKQAKAQRGLFIGSNPPYGYYSEKGKLKIRNDNTPKVVQRIYSKYLTGKGMQSIARTLTAEGVPTPSQINKRANASSLWHASTIRNILTNPHYRGDLVQNRTETISVTNNKRRNLSKKKMNILQDTHEPIISKDNFQLIQQHLKSRTRVTTKAKRHLFTNVISCEECQRGMWFVTNQKGYRCGGNIKHGSIFCVNKKVVREIDLKNIIKKDLQKIFQSFHDKSFMNSLIKKLNTKKGKYKAALQSLEREIAESNSRKLKYVDLYTDNIITRDELSEYQQLANQKLKDLNVSKSELLQKLDECTNQDYSLEVGKKLKAFLNLKHLSPKVLHSLVKKVNSDTEGNIRIHYNFLNPFQ